MTTAELSDTITTTNPANTRILTIQVENEDPELAREIADAVRGSASETIKDIMKIEAVNTVEEANLPTAPSSPSVFRNTLLGGVLGIILAMGVIILIYILRRYDQDAGGCGELPRPQRPDVHPDPGRRTEAEEGKTQADEENDEESKTLGGRDPCSLLH